MNKTEANLRRRLALGSNAIVTNALSLREARACDDAQLLVPQKLGIKVQETVGLTVDRALILASRDLAPIPARPQSLAHVEGLVNRRTTLAINEHRREVESRGVKGDLVAILRPSWVD